MVEGQLISHRQEQSKSFLIYFVRPRRIRPWAAGPGGGAMYVHDRMLQPTPGPYRPRRNLKGGQDRPSAPVPSVEPSSAQDATLVLRDHTLGVCGTAGVK